MYNGKKKTTVAASSPFWGSGDDSQISPEFCEVSNSTNWTSSRAAADVDLVPGMFSFPRPGSLNYSNDFQIYSLNYFVFNSHNHFRVTLVGQNAASRGPHPFHYATYFGRGNVLQEMQFKWFQCCYTKAVLWCESFSFSPPYTLEEFQLINFLRSYLTLSSLN